MDNLKRLDEIMPGDRAIIKKINTAGTLRRRLMDIGMIESTQVECVGRSPLGDPSAYLIRGAVIAIRSCDCADILVEPRGDENGND